MLANLADKADQVLDARSRARFEGTAPEPRAGLRAGHIPGSRNLPFNEIVDPAQQTLLDAAALRERFAAAGIDLQRPVATRSEEHTSELQSLMRISYAVFCLKKKDTDTQPVRYDDL